MKQEAQESEIGTITIDVSEDSSLGPAQTEEEKELKPPECHIKAYCNALPPSLSLSGTRRGGLYHVTYPCLTCIPTAFLQELLIEGGEQEAMPGKFFPRFDPTVTEYVVELPADPYNAVVSPTLSDSKATVTVGFASEGINDEQRPPKVTTHPILPLKA